MICSKEVLSVFNQILFRQK